MMGEVDCWCVMLDVPPETYASLYATLADDERDRSARFRFERDRRRFVVARGALRDVLGRYVGTPADQIRFVYNAFGKPELSPDCAPTSRLRFNVAHSADIALIAVAVDADVGVDVECVREDAGYAEIAQHFFSPDEVPLGGPAFFRCWTKREAYVKACGEGLGDGPVRFDGRWSFFSVEPAPGYVGALAVAGEGWRVTGVTRWEKAEGSAAG
jgi:4'-phosphopantetheinyl transferase